MKTQEVLTIMLYIAGAGQIFIALIYQWMRRIADWDADMARLQNPWNRQIAQTYSRYIQALNFAFGLIPILWAEAFFIGNPIATALAAIIALYWGVRFVLGLTYYQTDGITQQKKLYRFGAWGFNTLFAFIAVTFAAVVAVNI